VLGSVAACVLAYFIGAVPFGYLVARYVHGIDIRGYGSGNIGATNVWRVLGPVSGTAVLLADVGKGVLAVYLARALGGTGTVLAAGLAVLVGHSWSVFLGWRGGKIIATSLGVLLSLAPAVALAGLGVWVATVVLTGYVSLGSMAAAVSVPFLMLLTGRGWEYFLFGLALAVLAVYRHAENIRRLRTGTEFRVRLWK
jgi:glycerol-3-phosphate acyltransferase PlsY